MTDNRMMDRFRGCLIGGAAGDALGYEVEFSGERSIFRTYGPRGITEYALQDGLARFSDDTQMTLFTANGLLKDSPFGYPDSIYAAYLDWLDTQHGAGLRDKEPHRTWLYHIPELNVPRAPGNTCLSALGSGKMGSVAHPVNRSKGCGGVMRTAPVGLFFDGVHGLTGDDADRIGAEAAAITHGHPLGYLPGAVLAHIIRVLVYEDLSPVNAVRDAVEAMNRWSKEHRHCAVLTELLERALELAASDLPDLDAIHQLGEGWVGEEALAIAVFCFVRHADSFEDCLIAAVNHKGDSDSTGAIAGNMLGAYLGLQGIPDKFRAKLELYDTILSMADDLYYGRPGMEIPEERKALMAERYGI